MNSDIEYITYTDSERPVAYENQVAEDDGEPTGDSVPGNRTEALINQGRSSAGKGRLGRPGGKRLTRRHLIAAGVAGLALSVALAVVLSSGGASWPASVAVVKQQVDVACQNPDIASEPGQVNFACGQDTRQILWVFSLLTSEDNPAFSDTSTGRTGLEPIAPGQGGEIAWSLNLHHPYDPANPIDSLEVAARAINNIIGGAAITGQNGAQVVQPGLESKPGNCQRYTGSSALIIRQGFPDQCARPVTGAAGQAALVADVYEQWMVGAPSQDATNAATLYSNADNPGDPQVQAILHTLPNSGL